MTRSNSSGAAVVVDANVLISICSNETTLSTAANALANYASLGCSFHAPNVIVSEVLYVLCVKLQSNLLTPKAYERAVDDSEDEMRVIALPPQGTRR
jgi:predicted nucleic acid-binding protein